jgi:hypothetical protein
MLQIIHAVAPGARLLFASGFLGMAENIRALADAGANVIVDDLYFYEPMFADSPTAQAVDDVVARGVAYFSAAGNFADHSYQSTFVHGRTLADGAIAADTGLHFFGGITHDFNPGPGVDDLQQITIPAGQTLNIGLQWDSPYRSTSPRSPGSANDLDFYLLNSAGDRVVAMGATDNVGGDPAEGFSYKNAAMTPVTYNLMIVKDAGADPGLIKYWIDTNHNSPTIDEYATHSSTCFGHANARGAMAVGAAFYLNTPRFFSLSPPLREDFTSRGGTPILFDVNGNRLATPELRQHPDVVAPDGVNTTFFGRDRDFDGRPNFSGTSAAAPHAAAVAALLLQASPRLRPHDLYAVMRATAVDMGPTGYDADTGYGLIQATNALFALTGPLTINLNAGEQANDRVADSFYISYYQGQMIFEVNGDLVMVVPPGDVAAINVNGSTDDDDLVVDMGAGPITQHIQFYGGGGRNTFRLQGNPTSVPTETYSASGPGAGTITGSWNVGYSGVAIIADIAAVQTVNFNATNAAEEINVVYGPQVYNSGIFRNEDSVEINSGASGTFAPVDFNHKSTINVHGLAGNDTMTLNFTDTSVPGLTGIALDTGTGADTVHVRATPVNTLVDSQAASSRGETDSVTIGDSPTGAGGLLDGLGGAVTVQNLAGFTDLVVDDSGERNPSQATLDTFPTLLGTFGEIAGLAPRSIYYRINDGNGKADLNSLTINAGAGGNTFTVNNGDPAGAPFTTTLYSGIGVDSVNVLSTSANNKIVINGQDGMDAVHIGSNAPNGNGTLAAIRGGVVVRNSASYTDLVVDDGGDTTPRAPTLSTFSAQAEGFGRISGLGNPAPIDFRINTGAADTDLHSLVINGGSGGNTFTVNSTLPAGSFHPFDITLNTGLGLDTVNVQATSAYTTLTVQGEDRPDNVTVGSRASGSGGTLAGINGKVIVRNNVNFTNLVIDDSGDAQARTATLDTYTDGSESFGRLSGLGNAQPISFRVRSRDVSAVFINAGDGGNTFTINNTDDGTAPFTTTLNTGNLGDTVNVQSLTPHNPVTVNGQNGIDTFNVSPLPASTDLTLDGGNPGGSPGDFLAYLGPGMNNVTGRGAGTFTQNGHGTVHYSNIEDFPAATPMDATVSTATQANNGQPDSVRVVRNQSQVRVYVNGRLTFGADLATVHHLRIQGSGDDDTMEVDYGNGDPVPQGGLSADGGAGGNDSLWVKDRANQSPTDWTVTSTSVTRNGFATASQTTYSRVQEVRLSTGAGNDTIGIESTAVHTTIEAGDGDDAISIGRQGQSLNAFAGPVSADGGPGTNNSLAVQDQATTVATNWSVRDGEIDRQAGAQAVAITYQREQQMAVSTGQGNDRVVDQGPAIPATIDTGPGDDSIEVDRTQAATTVRAGSGNDAVAIGTPGGTLDDIQVPVAADGGSDADSITANDAQNTHASQWVIDATQVQRSYTSGRTTVTRQVPYSNFETVAASAGSGPNTFDIGGAAQDLSRLPQHVAIGGGAAADSASFNDQRATSATAWQVTPSKTTRTATAGGTTQVSDITYTGVEALAVHAGQQDDAVAVGRGTQDLDHLPPSVALDGGGGTNNTAAVDDTGPATDAAPVQWTITAAEVDRAHSGRMAAITYAHIQAVAVAGGASNDAFDVRSTSVDTTVDAGPGDDAISVGGGNLDNLQGRVTARGGAGQDALTADDHNNTQPSAWAVKADEVDRTTVTAARAISYDGVESVEADAGSAPDAFSIGGPAQGLSNIPQRVAIDGGVGNINNTATMDDTDSAVDAAPVQWTVTSAEVDRAHGGRTVAITYAHMNSVAVAGGASNDAFDVRSSSVDTTVDAGPGDDAISVGGGNLDNLQGRVTARGGAGQDALTADDHNNTQPSAWAVKADEVDRTDARVSRAVSYGGVETVAAVGGLGQDSFDIGGPAQDLSRLPQHVAIDGGASADSASFNDQQATVATSWQITAARATRTVPAEATQVSDITYNGVEALAVHAGQQDDAVAVGRGTQDLDHLPPSVALDGGGGTNNTAAVDDTGPATDAAPVQWTVTAAEVDRAHGGHSAAITYAHMQAVAVDGGASNDAFDVRSTSVDTTVDAGPGDDAISVGGGNLDNLQGRVTARGGAGQDALTADDHNNTQPSAWAVKADEVDRTAGTATHTVSYSDVEGVEADAGSGDNSVDVPSTSAPTTIRGGAADDTDRVGAGPNNLDGIRGRLTLDGGAGANQLQANDQNDANPSTWEVTASAVDRVAAPPGAPAVSAGMDYANFQSLAVNAGRGDDQVHARATSATTTINGGPGFNGVLAGNAANSLDGIQGALSVPTDVPASLGTTYLIVHDEGNAVSGRTYTLTADTLTRTGAAPITYGTTYSLAVYGGAGSNTYIVRGTKANSTLLETGRAADQVYLYGNGRQVNLSVYDDAVGASADTFFLGSDDPSGSTLAGLNGGILISCPQGHLIVDDHGDTQPRSPTIATNEVDNLTPAGRFLYSALTAEFYLGGGGNQVRVTGANDSGGLMTVHTGTGDDGVTLDFANDFFAHAVQIDGQGGNDSLTITDVNRDHDYLYQVAPTSVTRSLVTSLLTTTFGYTAVERVEIDGSNGNDIFTVSGSPVGIPLTLHGGTGLNTLDYANYPSGVVVNLTTGQATGFAGGVGNIANVVGTAFADTLTGNGLRNVLIGRGGGDQIDGGGDEDLLIGGTTAYDLNTAALLGIVREWARTDAIYAARVGHLRAGGGLNGTTVLTGATVLDDGAADTLTGGDGQDWFWGNSTQDATPGRQLDEQLN